METKIAQLAEDIAQLTEPSKIDELRQLCGETHPAAIAESFAFLEDQQINQVLSVLDTDQTARLFEWLNEEQQRDIAEGYSDEDLVKITSEMAADERVDLFQVLGERSEQIIRRMARSQREDIRRLASHAEGTAGAIMTSEYADLKPDLTVSQAIEKLRLGAPDKETIYYAYVVDANHRLLGQVSLRQLIMAKPHEKIESIMRRELVTVKVDESQEVVSERLSRFDLLAVPVIMADDTLVGIVTFDDALDVQEEEATIDFHRMANIGPLRGSFRDTSVKDMVLRRSPWLLVLVFMNIFSGAGIAYFEDTIEQVVALVFFLPLLIDSGGNAGSQSSTLMVRALATGDVKARDWLYLLRKELGVALAIGILMSLAVALVSAFRAPEVLAVVSMTMVLVVSFGCLVGVSLPFLLQRFNFDPATASAPLITSLADIGGVLIYFGIATWYLGL